MFTLEDAYHAVEGRSEFAIKLTDKTVCFDYIVILSDTFVAGDASKTGWIRRNFRGVTFCRETGKMLSLPFHKFFNINQNSETDFNLYKGKDATIYEKLDGSMVHFYRLTDGALQASTRRSPHSTQAQGALAFVLSSPELERNILETIDCGFTPIFEWVSPRNQIVVRYDQCRLVFLMSRSRETGKYFFENKYSDRALEYRFKFAEILQNLHHSEFEGYVCHFENGDMLKAKTPWYLERHRAVDALMRPTYKVYEVALDGLMDDLIAISVESYKIRLQSIHDEVQKDILQLNLQMESVYQEINSKIVYDIKSNQKEHRKSFVEMAKTTNCFSELMQIYQGKNPESLYKKKLMEKYTEMYPERFFS